MGTQDVSKNAGGIMDENKSKDQNESQEIKVIEKAQLVVERMEKTSRTIKNLEEFFEQERMATKLVNQKINRIRKKKTLHRAKVKQIGKDSSGKKIYETYLPNAFMLAELEAEFPFSSWVPAHDPLIGEDAVYVGGILEIIDLAMYKYLVSMGIPPERADFKRRWYGAGASKIKKLRSGKPLNENNDIKAANTEAVKYAINRATHIGDDTYKRMENPMMEGHEYAEAVEFLSSLNFMPKDIDMAMNKLFTDVTSDTLETWKKICRSKEVEIEE